MFAIDAGRLRFWVGVMGFPRLTRLFTEIEGGFEYYGTMSSYTDWPTERMV